MPLIAPGVCRYTIVGESFSEDILNVFDIHIDADIGASRADYIPDIGGDLLNQWADHILPLMHGSYIFKEVRWVDLDSPTGVTGSRTSTDGTTLPASGSRPGTPLPNAVYAKVRKNLEGQNRQERSGMTRLSCLVENDTADGNGNQLKGPTVNDINAGFEALKDGINGAIGDTTQNLVVVHTVDRVYTGRSDIANFSAQYNLGTLKGRMPGYGD